MIGLRRINPRIPNVLVAVVVTTLIAWVAGFEQRVQVPLASVGPADIQERIAEYDRVVETRQQLEELRVGGARTFAELEQNERRFCLRCHGVRDVADFATGPARELGPGDADKILALHQLAGLIGDHLDEVKRRGSAVRDELRSLAFVEVDSGGDGPRFLVRDAADPDQRGGATWRLKISNRALGTEALTLNRGGAVVGVVPAGLPSPRVPRLEASSTLRLLPTAMIISILGFMEAISIAKAMAARTRQRLDPNQELIGQGLANLLGCLTQSYAVSGSFSRSAVNLQAGARTGVSNVVSSGVVVIVLIFLSKWLYFLPQATLAAIIMMAVAGLLNVRGFVHAWRAQRLDGIVAVVTFVATLLVAPHLEWGIALGVLLSLGGYLFRTMRPNVAELGFHPDGSLQDIERFELAPCQHLAVIRFDGPLNFASAGYLEDAVLARLAHYPRLKQIVLAAGGINEIDASGEDTLRLLVDRLREAHYGFAIAALKDRAADVLRRSHLYEQIGPEHVFATPDRAVAATYAAAHVGSDETACPFRSLRLRVAELSLHPDGSLRDATRHGLVRCRHIAALRFDDALSFANTGGLLEQVERMLANQPDLKQVILVVHGVTDIDAPAATRLADVVRRLRMDALEVVFSGVNDEVAEVLRTTGALETIGRRSLYPTQVAAVAATFARAHRGSPETSCPLRGLAPRFVEMTASTEGTLIELAGGSGRACREMALLRLEGPMALSYPDALWEEFRQWADRRAGVRDVVVSCQALHHMDSFAAGHLLEFVRRVRHEGYDLLFCNFPSDVFDALARTGIADAIGLDCIYPVAELAIAAVHPRAHPDGGEAECPFRTILPRLHALGRHADGSFKDAELHDLSMCERILPVRFDGPLNFATIGLFEEELFARIDQMQSLRAVVVVGHGISRLDALAAQELGLLVQRLRREGCRVVLSDLRDDVAAVLDRTAATDERPSPEVFPTLAQALDELFAMAHEGCSEDDCPFGEVARAVG
jgi:anti-anti-sigma factor